MWNQHVGDGEPHSLVAKGLPTDGPHPAYAAGSLLATHKREPLGALQNLPGAAIDTTAAAAEENRVDQGSSVSEVDYRSVGDRTFPSWGICDRSFPRAFSWERSMPHPPRHPMTQRHAEAFYHFTLSRRDIPPHVPPPVVVHVSPIPVTAPSEWRVSGGDRKSVV